MRKYIYNGLNGRDAIMTRQRRRLSGCQDMQGGLLGSPRGERQDEVFPVPLQGWVGHTGYC